MGYIRTGCLAVNNGCVRCPTAQQSNLVEQWGSSGL